MTTNDSVEIACDESGAEGENLVNGGSRVFAHGSTDMSQDEACEFISLLECALRDIKAAAAAGRFRVDDPQLALAVAAGALFGLGKLLQDEPERDDVQAADKVTEDLLRLFGMTAEEAREVCQRPLPDIDGVTRPGSAARISQSSDPETARCG